MNQCQPGGTIGGYRLERLIDDTGRSQVWVAHDQRLDRNAALKVRYLADAQDAELEQARFAEQARTAARIEHPGVVPVYETGSEGEAVFLAMRYVHGRNLAQWRRSTRDAASASIFRLLEPVALAIDHAHGVGLAHGSLTAESIVVDEAAAPNRAVLLPFAGVEGRYGGVEPGTAEADRLAFTGILQSLLDDSAPLANGLGAASCLEALRAALPSGIDGPLTPQTVIRTRRTRSGRTRLTVGLTTAAVVAVAAITAVAFLADVADQVQEPDASDVGAQESPDPAANGVEPARLSGASTRTVLILGDDFDSREGDWSRKRRAPSWRFKKGVSAADAIEAAFLAVPDASGIVIEREPLNVKTPARCRDAVATALERRAYIAIVVLQSPCSTGVMRQIGAREAEIPPVYWLDNGRDSRSLLVPMGVAPLRNAAAEGDTATLDAVRRDLGGWTGEAAARVLPFGTYSDVGRFARREFGITEPCMYLPTTPWDPADVPLDRSEQLRIDHSVFEIATGFNVDATDIESRPVWVPTDGTGTPLLPRNGTVTGSTDGDSELVTAIRRSGAPCVVPEIGGYPHGIGLPWGARLLNLLNEELPTIRIFHWSHPNELYAPPAPKSISATDAAAWREIEMNDQAWMLSSAPYTPPESPLSGHVWEVTDSLYRPIDYGRDYWWWTDHYALVLVAELIARQTVDTETGRHRFGSIPRGEWSDAETDFLDEEAEVALDPVERIYSGYLVSVHHKGEGYLAFYGGASP